MMAKIMLSSMRMRASLTLSRSRLREGEPMGLPLSTAAHLPLATPASLGLVRLACHRRHDAAGCEVADPSPPILAHDLADPFLQAALMGVLCPSALSREAPWHLALARPALSWKTLCSDFSWRKPLQKIWSFGAFRCYDRTAALGNEQAEEREQPAPEDAAGGLT